MKKFLITGLMALLMVTAVGLDVQALPSATIKFHIELGRISKGCTGLWFFPGSTVGGEVNFLGEIDVSNDVGSPTGVISFENDSEMKITYIEEIPQDRLRENGAIFYVSEDDSFSFDDGAFSEYGLDGVVTLVGGQEYEIQEDRNGYKYIIIKYLVN